VRVAILGATGHVGRSLAVELGGRESIELVLVARAPVRARAFAESNVAGSREIAAISELESLDAEVLVQCAGVGDPARVGMDVLDIEASIDAAFTSWLTAHPGACGVAFSSGAVYDTAFECPVDDATPTRDPAAEPALPGEAYAVAKARTEARHRSVDLPIVDLRLFGYFTRLVDPSAAFLMNDLVGALRSGTVLAVGSGEIVRDYSDPADLADLVIAAAAGGRNDAFDVVSAAPVSLSAILEHFAGRYSLGYTVRDDGGPQSVTGAKPAYYSISRRTEALGFRPRFSAIETLDREVAAILAS
jgi:nucleoside-diphosphate-sugar epimerase